MGRRIIRNMEELAIAVGVSRPTVSKYFNDHDSVRKEIRKRIEACLRSTDYRPNIYATNLNRKTPRAIGILIPHFSDPFYTEMLRLLETKCLSRGYRAITLSSHGDKQIEKQAVQTLLSLKVAGAIVAPLGFESDAEGMRSLRDNMAVIFLDAKFGGQAPFVGTNNAQSIGLLVQYLSRTGEHPTYFGMPKVNENELERKEAYVAAMEKLGLQPIVIDISAMSWNFEEIGFLEGGKILDRSGFPTKAVLCANDRLAFGVMSAACQRGLKIGRAAGCDLRVAGHDDHPLSRYSCPALTTVAQDFDGIASAGINTLFDIIGSGSERGELDVSADLRLDARLIMRASA